MASASTFPRIKEVRTFIIDGVGSGGDYHNVGLDEYLIYCLGLIDLLCSG